MKARIIVALIIMLSMCMACAAVSHEDKVYWRSEGIDDGNPYGYHDGYVDTDKSYLNMDYPNDCKEEHESSYKLGYEVGYNQGYTNGALDSVIEVPSFPKSNTDDHESPIIIEPKPTSSTVKDDTVNSMSSPAMGFGFKLPDGTITKRGDQLPTLYTWAAIDDKYEHYTTLTFPEAGTYTGCVIITPPQIAGEPLVPTGFWDTPKGQRILQWRANAG